MAGIVRKVSYLWDSLFFLRKLSKLEPVVNCKDTKKVNLLSQLCFLFVL